MSDLTIIGRERHLVNNLTKQLQASAKGHELRKPVQERRGSRFDVRYIVDGERTGHIFRVTVEVLPRDHPDYTMED